VSGKNVAEGVLSIVAFVMLGVLILAMLRVAYVIVMALLDVWF
jgi:hypothetical protein